MDLRSFYTHQHCELPDILLHVIHFNLYKGRCANCGKEGKAKVPAEYSTGYGPNFTAFVGSASAFLWCTRRSLLDFLTKSDFFRTEEGESVPLSLGGLDRLIDRCSQALSDTRRRSAKSRVRPLLTMSMKPVGPCLVHLERSNTGCGLWLRLWPFSSISTDIGAEKPSIRIRPKINCLKIDSPTPMSFNRNIL